MKDIEPYSFQAQLWALSNLGASAVIWVSLFIDRYRATQSLLKALLASSFVAFILWLPFTILSIGLSLLQGGVLYLGLAVACGIWVYSKRPRPEISPHVSATGSVQSTITPPPIPALAPTPAPDRGATQNASRYQAIVQAYRDDDEDEASGWLNEHVAFAYVNAAGEHSEREVRVSKAWPERFSGYCYLRQKRVTFRYDRIVGDIIRIDTGELVSVEKWRKNWLGRSATKKPASGSRASSSTAKQRDVRTVVFTGFKHADRSRLEQMAEEAGLSVSKTVGAKLNYLVTGANAGPSKVAKALDLGIEVMDEEEFMELLISLPYL